VFIIIIIIEKYKQHKNVATMKREMSLVNTVSYQSYHINTNKNHNDNDININVVLPHPIFPYHDASSMIARQKLATVPTLFASETHRSRFINSMKSLPKPRTAQEGIGLFAIFLLADRMSQILIQNYDFNNNKARFGDAIYLDN
jgi:hypothetical protein